VCGIFGIIDRSGIAEDDRRLLGSLADGLVHRGPDDGGLAVSGQAAIGMRRLAIIDPANGRQPLWNEERTVCLVANGEIYNFVELRAELEARGHRFATGSDCETIVHLYEEMGAACVTRLRGMFAFALHDLGSRKVLLARDRVGEKPLALAEREGRIVFASELGALVRSGALPFEVDRGAVHEYLHWGFVPEPRSAVKGSRKLPAGHLLEVSLDPWRVSERAWWSALDAPAIEGSPSEAVAGVLDEVARIVVRSDVPVGVALSGGVDSALVASMARGRGGDVHAFTVGYGGRDRHDETAMAAETARHLGLVHHRVTLSASDVVSAFRRMCALRDEPNADISGPGYLALMEASRAHGVPVLLMGQGGDELFWGYGWTKQALRETERKARLLDGSVGAMAYVRPSRPPASRTGAIGWALGGAGIRDGLRSLRRDRSAPPGRIVFWDQRAAWHEAAAAEPMFMEPGFMHSVRGTDPAAHFTFDRLPDRADLAMTDLLVRTYLLSNGLDQCDRLSMAASVECRVPLVDYRLVETVIGLRKVNRDWRLPAKQWLLDAVGGQVPAEVFLRRKRGFTPPWRSWTEAIFADAGRDLEDGALCEAGVLRPEGARWLARNPIDGLGRPHPLAMPLLMLEEWMRSLRDAGA
jgi:asparagine synthase (glutamine-hydrolysing)